MRSGRSLLWLILAVAVIGAVVSFSIYRVTRDEGQASANKDVVADHVAYEFIWPEGATRGVEIPSEIYIPSSGKRLPIYTVGDMRSEPGDDLVAFLQRVRKEMTTYSDRQTFETCALICSDGNTGYSVRMTSVGAVAHCAVAPVCLEGYATLQQSIHSHCPRRPGLRATRADEYLSGGTMRNRRPFGLCAPDRFSTADFQGLRPGWLAGTEALHRQDGESRTTTYQ